MPTFVPHLSRPLRRFPLPCPRRLPLLLLRPPHHDQGLFGECWERRARHCLAGSQNPREQGSASMSAPLQAAKDTHCQRQGAGQIKSWVGKDQTHKLTTPQSAPRRQPQRRNRSKELPRDPGPEALWTRLAISPSAVSRASPAPFLGLEYARGSVGKVPSLLLGSPTSWSWVHPVRPMVAVARPP